MKNKTYLTTAEGNYVLNASGQKIEIKTLEDSNLPSLTDFKEDIGLFTFTNPNGLTATDNGCFLETGISGKAEAVKPVKSKTAPAHPPVLMQGALENSAVDLAEEMVNVIQSQRAFQFNAKIVQVSDQIEDIINNLR
jgi:flagellar basal body rod protein FlgG